MALYEGFCTVENCEKHFYAKEFCRKHYDRFRKYGDPLAGGTFYGEPETFFKESLNQETDECIIWKYGRDTGGYGNIYWEGKSWKVHRLSCYLTYGPPKAHMDAAHGPCHNTLCFNPRHLSWKTEKENMEDRIRDGTHTYGETAGRAKLSESQVVEIRQRYAAGGTSHRKLAAEYDMAHCTIGAIIRGTIWSHMT